ncbi:MAG: glycerol-3-phosphate dehydrogenase [Planctomycetes bacterium]|jgi:glycerol-3-phosphate dehydrogenase (NAD(P)+)|nr:glycerol-3-phosphate dehydrogenase [Planctomycetota bacterium]HJO25698.1 NAD(P)H-dependent glycerol-3-phosphate dehydrogenase [Planctomycetota bacterium]
MSATEHNTSIGQDAGPVLVIGDGSWGTTLALVLARRGVPTTLWSAFPEQAEELLAARENKRFLPGVALPESLAISADPWGAAEAASFVVSVVPTQFLRSVAERFQEVLPADVPLVTATKGLEIETFRTPGEILLEVLGERPLCVLTGPSHAEEVAAGKPASLVAASSNRDFARDVQRAFTSESFRVYVGGDSVGAELAGALKNVIALAAGISDGLELGDNAKAALLTRGMVEMARFGVARGAQADTFFGLAGFGDLVTTCCSPHSRNRAVGERIGRGQTLREILEEMDMVAEGVWTTKALFGPNVDTGDFSLPIAEQVHAILFEDKPARAAVLDLMRREVAGEMDGVLEAR